MTYQKQIILDCRLCLSVKAFKFQTNLVTTSSMKRKRTVVTIEAKLEIINQPVIGASNSSLAVHYNIGIIDQLSKPSPKSQLFWIIGVLLYMHYQHCTIPQAANAKSNSTANNIKLDG